MKINQRKINLPCVLKGSEFKFVKLVDNNNVFHEKILLRDAVDIAKKNNLEVVCFNDESKSGATLEIKDLAFCKVINFGKWKYNQDKKIKKDKKEHKKVTKEIRIGIDISDNDVNHKIKQAIEFLKNGDDVIFSMFLKGRQKTRVKDAISKMDEIKEMCSDFGGESARHNVIPNITLRLSPTSGNKNKNKKQEDGEK